jgi:hypothetical protein
MWLIETTETFDEWYRGLEDADRENVLASILVLRHFGPRLGRPHADTVKGSGYSNMKELRIQSKGKPLRAFFAFDPARKGVLLCGGNKGGGDKRFYEKQIALADREFAQHLESLKRSDDDG